MNRLQDSRTEEIYPLLSYCCTTSSGPRQGSADYLIEFDVKILGEYAPEDLASPTREIQLGNLRATLIRVGRAYEEGFSLFDLFDHSREIHDFASALFEPGYGEFVEPIRKIYPNAFPHEDILSIHWLTVNPMARGQRVGASALHRFMTDWETGCSLIAIQALPMQFAPNIREQEAWETLSLENLTTNREEATAKLENHFRGLGFRQVEALPYMLMCPAIRQTPLEEMALEDSLVLSREDLEDLEDQR